MGQGAMIDSGRSIHINYTSYSNKLTKTHVNHDVCKPSFLSSLRYSSSKNKPFVDNRIKTAKYSALSFIPLQLLFQFKKIANLYFVLISALQLVPDWSPTGKYTTIVPLSIFVSISMLKEAFDDYKRHINDAIENNHSVSRIRINEGAVTGNSPVFDVEKVWCMRLQVGDIIRLREHELVPADILVLSTSSPNGECFVETSNLDGETNLKLKQSITIIHNSIKNNTDNLNKITATINAETPNSELYTFQGGIGFDTGNISSKASLGTDQILLRGSTLRNTTEIIAIVLYTGEETKIRMNSNKASKAKSSTLQRHTNRMVVLMFIVLLSLSITCTIASYIWNIMQGDGRHWYLENNRFKPLEIFFSFLILFNALIPISLYVTMEMVKLMQTYLMNSDLGMYDHDRNIAAKCYTSNLNEELGQVEYIFSDKTGTLTENIMLFKRFSVNGESFAVAEVSDLQSRNTSREDAATHIISNTENIILDLYNAHLNELSFSMAQQNLWDLLEAIALCHSCIPERRSTMSTPGFVFPKLSTINDEDYLLTYQSSSPDDTCSVDAARDFRFVLRERNQNASHLRIFGTRSESIYEILNVIPFSPARKRMSVIYKYPDGRIILVCKGADSVIFERSNRSRVLTGENITLASRIQEHVNHYATDGLRTLVYARRVLTQEQYDMWAHTYSEALSSHKISEKEIETIVNTIECDLELLGATAIEDKLQKDVPETISMLEKANIKLWMLTGDKKETAINVGLSCCLIKPVSSVFVVGGCDLSSIYESINVLCENMKTLKQGLGSLNLYREKEEEHIVIVIEGVILSEIMLDNVESSSTLKESRNAFIQKHSIERNLRREVFLRKLICACISADGVICSRFSPQQKALIIKMVRSVLNEIELQNISVWQLMDQQVFIYRSTIWKNVLSFFRASSAYSGVTLAIGDGANDIPMLECAHVGIGITGREGLAASRASDYSISQFRFLQQLLFVHGRWNYLRTSKFVLGSFYKSVVFYTCQALFQVWTGFSGTSVFEQWTLALFNILFSSLPVIVVGMFEKDLPKETLLEFPQLYKFGQTNQGFNFTIFSKWILQGFYAMLVAVLVPVFAFSGFTFSDMSGPFQESSLFMLGTIIYTSVVFIITIKVGYLESENKTYITHTACAIMIGMWFFFQFTYSSFIWPTFSGFGYDVAGMWYSIVNIQAELWTMVLISVITSLVLFDYLCHCHKRIW